MALDTEVKKAADRVAGAEAAVESNWPRLKKVGIAILLILACGYVLIKVLAR